VFLEILQKYNRLTMWRRAGGRDGNWYVSVCVDITSGMIGNS